MEAKGEKSNCGLQIGVQLLHSKERPKRPLISHPPGFFHTDDEFEVYREITCQETQNMALKDEAEEQTMNKMEEDSSFFSSDGVYQQNKDETACRCPLAKDPQETKHTTKVGRGRKYTIDEDIAICKAVAATSKYGETCKYWDRIFTIFEALHANPEGRTQHGICNRFFVINKEVMKYINILAHVRRNEANSLTEVNVVRTARAEYYSHEGKPFAFEECYKILQSMPSYFNKTIQMNNTHSRLEEGGASTITTPTTSIYNLNDVDLSLEPENEDTISSIRRTIGRSTQSANRKSKVSDEDLGADERTKRRYTFSSSEGLSQAQAHQAKKVPAMYSSPANSTGEADALSVQEEFNEARRKSSFHGSHWSDSHNMMNSAKKFSTRDKGIYEEALASTNVTATCQSPKEKASRLVCSGNCAGSETSSLVVEEERGADGKSELVTLSTKLGGNEELIADAVGRERSLVSSVDKECVVGAGNEKVAEQVVLMENVKDVFRSRIPKVEERDDQVERVIDNEVCHDEHNIGVKKAKVSESAHQGNMGENCEQVEMRYGLDGQAVKDVGEVVDKNNSVVVVSGISGGAVPTCGIGPPTVFSWSNDIYDSVEGFKVLKEFGPLYRKIWLRYGHIPPPSTLKQESLGIVGICTDILVDITEMRACTISDVSEDHLASWEERIALGQSLKFNLDWLVKHLSKIRTSLKPWGEMAVGLESTRKALGAAEMRLTQAFRQHDERAARVAALQKEMDQLIAQLKEDTKAISQCEKEIQIHQMVLDSIWSPALQKSLVDDLF